jgi:fatty-acyl-CoA synthase
VKYRGSIRRETNRERLRMGNTSSATWPTSFREALEAVSGIDAYGHTYIGDDGKEVWHSYAELTRLVRARAAGLEALGLVKGDAVAFAIPDPRQFVISFLGCLFAGIVPVPLYPPVALGKLDAYFKHTGAILRKSEARLLLTTKQVKTLIWPITEEAPRVRDVLAVESLEDGSPERAPADVQSTDCAFLQFTSGSTSSPKGVVVPHGALSACAISMMANGLHAGPTDTFLSWLPMFHDMGLVGFVVLPLFSRSAAVYLPTFSFIKRPAIWLDRIHRHRATISFAPNFAYALAAKRATDAQIAGWDLSSWRIAGCGAEPISPATVRAFEERFAPARFSREAFQPAYGLAEATLAVSFKPVGTRWRTEIVDAEIFRSEGRAVAAVAGSEPLELVSCGAPLPDQRVRILDEDGRPLQDRLVGEIECTGPNVAAGYFGDAEATAAVFRDGALATGDLGFLAEGELFVTGRKKDVVIVHGRNYEPQSIEWVVERVDGVRPGNVVAFSRPAAATEELVLVCETRAEPSEELRRAIVSRVNEELSLAVADVVLLPAGTLPKTSSGKLQRRKTREQYVDGTLGGEGSRDTRHTPEWMQWTGHLMRSMASRVRHTVRRAIEPDD